MAKRKAKIICPICPQAKSGNIKKMGTKNKIKTKIILGK